MSRAMRCTTPRPLLVRPRFPADQDFETLSYQAGVLGSLNFGLMVLQNREPPAFFLFRNRITHRKRRGIRPGRVLERKDAVVLHFLQQTEGLLALGFCLAWNVHNNVLSDRDRFARFQ